MKPFLLLLFSLFYLYFSFFPFFQPVRFLQVCVYFPLCCLCIIYNIFQSILSLFCHIVPLFWTHKKNSSKKSETRERRTSAENSFDKNSFVLDESRGHVNATWYLPSLVHLDDENMLIRLCLCGLHCTLYWVKSHTYTRGKKVPAIKTFSFTHNLTGKLKNKSFGSSFSLLCSQEHQCNMCYNNFHSESEKQQQKGWKRKVCIELQVPFCSQEWLAVARQTSWNSFSFC